MKTICRLLVVFLTVLVSSFSNVGQSLANPPSQKTDESKIRENVAYMQQGWNTKSGALFAKPFAEDADYVVINGMQIKNRRVIEQAHQQIFDTIYKDSVIRLSVKQIRYLRSDVALVHVSGHNKTRHGELTTETEVIISLVMTKEGKTWKIVAFQNTEVIKRPGQ